MNTAAFETWMLRTGNDPGATRSRISNLRRLEAVYGELDSIYEKDSFASLLKELLYTKDDERNGRPNSTLIPINGNIYNGLATLRAAVSLYKRFSDESVPGRTDVDAETDASTSDGIVAQPDPQELTFALERDLQTALRTSIAQLEDGLTIIDGGVERSYPSGRIDILAQDTFGARVVIELKAVRATREAVAQIMSYMGDVEAESDAQVRGILVAPSFDDRAVSAARMARGLQLVTYAYRFTFTPRA